MEQKSNETPEHHDHVQPQDLNTGAKVECSICLADIEDADQNTRLSCGHVYHTSCINGWLESKLSCPLCKGEVEESLAPQSAKAVFKPAVSHQEMQRIVDEIEAFLKTNPDVLTWISVRGLTLYLCMDLGYADEDEFEDAMGGGLVELLRLIPLFEIEDRESGPYIRLNPNVTSEPQRPCIRTFHVCDREDLWRVFMKSPDAIVEIPEIEFEIGRGDKREIDNLYNFITGSVLNLSQYCRVNRDTVPEQCALVGQTIDNLNRLLDVEEPWTWIVHDTAGNSTFRPDDAVQVRYLDEATPQITEEDAPRITEEE